MPTTSERPIKRLRTIQEVTADLIKSGHLTQDGLDEAQRELEADPEWQAFLAAQPKPQAA